MRNIHIIAVHRSFAGALVLTTWLAACGSSTTEGEDTAVVPTDAATDTVVGESCRIDKECVPESDCLIGTCDSETKTCQYTPKPDFCAVDGACYSPGAANPENACQVCDPEADPLAFTYEDGKSGWVSEPSPANDGTSICVNPCARYCETINAACRGDLAQYIGGFDPGEVPDNAGEIGGVTECTTYCENWEDLAVDPANASQSNTVLCRLENAQIAGNSADDALLHCPAAGPSGGGLCGSWCENYCHLAVQNCGMFESVDECMEPCQSLPKDGAPGDTEGDSVQCRIYYLGIAKQQPGNCADGAISNSTKCRAQAAPQGDSCSQPLTVDTLPFLGQASTKLASSEYRQACSAGGPAEDNDPNNPGANDHAWRLDTDGNLAYTVTLTPDFDAALYVLSGDCGALSCVDAPIQVDAKQTRSLSFEPTAAGTYYIIVDGREPPAGESAPAVYPSGTYTLSVKSGPTCSDYCSTITQACTGENQQYPNLSSCETWCRHLAALPTGSTSDSTGNTVGCRMLYAVKAKAIASQLNVCIADTAAQIAKQDQLAALCTKAGMTGEGETISQCGTLCENYCHLAAHRCSGQPGYDFGSGISKCINSCNAIKENGEVGTESGNSKHCRFSFISTITEPPGEGEVHPAELDAATCANASLQSSPVCTGVCQPDCAGRACGSDGCGGSCGECSGVQLCSSDGQCLPDCEGYCDTIGCNCTDDLAQFENREACVAFCTEYTKAPEDEGQVAKTLDCLDFHATRAGASPELHCPLAGEAGAETCGTWCDSYCTVITTNCTGINAEFANVEACQTVCAEYPVSDAGSAKTNVDEDTLQCRLHYAVLAGSDDPTISTAGQCDAAKAESTKCTTE